MCYNNVIRLPDKRLVSPSDGGATCFLRRGTLTLYPNLTLTLILTLNLTLNLNLNPNPNPKP